MFSLRLTKNGIAPDLRRKAAAVADKKPLLRAMGMAAVTLAKQSFGDASLRPAEWPPLKRPDKPKPHAPLRLSGTLFASIRVLKVSNSQVDVGTHTPYAAVHQLGSVKLSIPARPFLPFAKNGALTETGKIRVERALRAALAARGIR